MNTKFLAAGAVVPMLTAVSSANADGDPKRGATVHRTCVACHSLEPHLNLIGPGLAGMWGKIAHKHIGPLTPKDLNETILPLVRKLRAR